MKSYFEDTIWEYMKRYCKENEIKNIWEKPIVKFANASNPYFIDLKEVVVAGHFTPKEYLPTAKTVVSYFLPFIKEISSSNIKDVNASKEWAEAYLDTNAMATEINQYLVKDLKKHGVAACNPYDIGMISKEIPKSKWSQRHVAYIAGHGTFGINNMLISDQGCVGRYFSIITELDAKADPIVSEERCLYKKNGSCKICVKRCVADALTVETFDRFKCLEQCLKNESQYEGADVCGKCVVGLPCSHKLVNNSFS